MRCRTVPRQRRCQACTGTGLYGAELVPTNRAPSVCACAHARCIVFVIRMAIQDDDDDGMHRRHASCPE